MLPTDKQARKERPIASGVLGYFPDAIAEVAHVSFVGNQQHNPGQPMHWARHKSTDHADCVARHLLERGTIDDDGMRHSAKAAWRALALLQLELEQAKTASIPDAVEFDPASGPDTSVTFITDRDPEVYTLPETEALNDWLHARDMDDEFAKPSFLDTRQFEVECALTNLGCVPKVANQIRRGTSTTEQYDPTCYDKYVYIAGPMRGYEKFNFPAFDASRDAALQKGWNVISPADVDRADGIKEQEHTTGDATPFDQRVFVYRDFFALYYIAHTEGGAIAMIPGWEKSTGAVGEFFLARWLGLKVLDAKTGRPLGPLTVDYNALKASIHAFLFFQSER